MNSFTAIGIGLFALAALLVLSLLAFGTRVRSMLVLRYLLRRRIAWVALVAVTLCTSMVIVIISVMGGWLEMAKLSFHGRTGDVVVSTGATSGFPYYQEMVQKIERISGVAGAAPAIKAEGAVRIGSRYPDFVMIFGYPIDKIGSVNNFPVTLYRQYEQCVEDANDSSLPENIRQEARKEAAKAATQPSFGLFLPPEVYREAVPNAHAHPGDTWPGMIIGAGVMGLQKKTARPERMYVVPTRLMMLNPNQRSVDLGGMGTVVQNNYWIVDDSRTGVWQYDQKSVYVPFDVLQKDLGMDARTEEVDGRQVSIPARASELYVKGKPGASLTQLRDEVEGVVHEVLEAHKHFEPYLTVQTWEQSEGLWLGAIEKEEVLVVVLFGVVSLVAAMMIFCIFYMIVMEKMRDIGIIKSVGATSASVAGIFLSYGLAIGVVGSALGLIISYGIVHNINEIHKWLGDKLGVKIWDPQVYIFDSIPNKMDPKQVTVILAMAVFFAVAGALLPAIRAAKMNPVESLRWE